MPVHLLAWASPWLMSRATGLAALMMLMASVLVGYLYRRAIRRRDRRAPHLAAWHRALGISALALAAFHALVLRHDGFMPFDWAAVLVPFRAPYRPFWTGLGTLALYGMALILITFDGRSRLGATWWRRAHRLLSWVVWAGATVHAIQSGTDLGRHPALQVAVLLAAGLGPAVLGGRHADTRGGR